MNRRRLYRCTHDRRLAGVAGGMAEYLDLDPTLVRLLWVISVFFGGITILLYVVMALIVPEEPAWAPATGPAGQFGPASASPAAGPDGAPSAEAADAGTAGPWWTTGQAGQAAAPGWVPSHGWAPAEPHRHRDRRGPGIGAPFFGTLLILFGGLALADQLLPAWAVGGHFLWPAFILGVGVLLVVTAIRRQPREQTEQTGS